MRISDWSSDVCSSDLQAFDEYLRRGLTAVDDADRALLREHRAQSTTDGAGGYTIPTGFVADLIKSLKAWGPMLDPGITRDLVTASGNQIEMPPLNDPANQSEERRVGKTWFSQSESRCWALT